MTATLATTDTQRDDVRTTIGSAPVAMTRRDEVAITFFSTWVIVGLFVDGWAHIADKPETFWTPWHAVLYSGFAAGMLWGFLEDRKEHGLRALVPRRETTPDRLVVLGFALFAGGGVADMIWHTVFGVEANLEALVSPSHLILMIGGLLLTTTAFRSAWRQMAERAPSLRTFLPATVSLMLAVSVISFFVQYGSPFVVEGETMAGATAGADLTVGLLTIQLTNVLLMGAVLLVLRRWHPPLGTFTVVFGGVALMMTGLLAFDQIALVAPAVVAGATADVLVRRGRGARVLGPVVPVVLWATWFIVYDAVWGLGWSVELWSGSIVFAALGGYGMALLAFPSPPVRERLVPSAG